MNPEEEKNFKETMDEALTSMYKLGRKHATEELKWKKKEFHFIAGALFMAAGYFAYPISVTTSTIFLILGMVEMGYAVHEGYKELKIIKADLKRLETEERKFEEEEKNAD